MTPASVWMSSYPGAGSLGQALPPTCELVACLRLIDFHTALVYRHRPVASCYQGEVSNPQSSPRCAFGCNQQVRPKQAAMNRATPANMPTTSTATSCNGPRAMAEEQPCARSSIGQELNRHDSCKPVRRTVTKPGHSRELCRRREAGSFAVLAWRAGLGCAVSDVTLEEHRSIKPQVRVRVPPGALTVTGETRQIPGGSK